MTKHTDGAERAAKTIIQEVLILNRNDLLRFLDDADVPGGLTDCIATIIDQETAAPELLEAIQHLLEQFEKWEGYHEWGEEDEIASDRAKAAITKAEPPKTRNPNSDDQKSQAGE